MKSDDNIPVILVVEDDPDIRRLICTYLRAGGYEYLEAGNGADGIAAVRDHGPKLVVLDIGLPDMSGIEVCKMLRKKYKDLPILILTARMDKAAYQSVVEVGASDFLVKPVRGEKLYPVVEKLLEQAGKKKHGWFS